MIAVGVDTHKDRHWAAALSDVGAVLDKTSVEATRAGFCQLVDWVLEIADDQEIVFGVEGAGSWGATLAEHLKEQGFEVFEVDRPRRRDRRHGKSDAIDAIAAAKAVLCGERTATPRARGIRECLRVTLVGQHSCTAERTRLHNQIQSLWTTAPEALKEKIGRGNGAQLERRLSKMRHGKDECQEEAMTLDVMRGLARRAKDLAQEGNRHKQTLTGLVRSLDATLLDELGVGPVSAAKLLVADVRRFRCEAAFARCNGTAPIPASSGRTQRYRLCRGGDRQVNHAIHMIALTRSVHDPETKAYLARKRAEGKTHRDAMRCVKRQLSRRLFKRLNQVALTT